MICSSKCKITEIKVETFSSCNYCPRCLCILLIEDLNNLQSESKPESWFYFSRAFEDFKEFMRVELDENFCHTLLSLKIVRSIILSLIPLEKEKVPLSRIFPYPAASMTIAMSWSDLLSVYGVLHNKCTE